MTIITTVASRPRRFRVVAALAAVLVYVLLAAGLGNLLSGLVGDDQEAAQFALGHLIPLPIGIVLLVLYVRWAGNSSAVWRERPTLTLTPHRWYLLAIPVLAVGISIAGTTEVPWAERGLGIIALVTVGTLLVGFGEELAVRGILLAAVRERHGELVTLLATSFVFALIHIPGSIIAGNSPVFIVIQVAGLMVGGATYYWIRRVTGRLWVGAVVHAFSDWVLYLAMNDVVPATSMPQDHTATDTILGDAELVLWFFLAISVISVIREDHRNRQQRATIAP